MLVAGGALKATIFSKPPSFGIVAERALETIRPAMLYEILKAGLIRVELSHELQ